MRGEKGGKGGRGREERRERWRRQGKERAEDWKDSAIIVEKSVPFPRTDSHVAVELSSSRSLHPHPQLFLCSIPMFRTLCD